MTAVPAATPETTPVALTVATVAVAQCQVPKRVSSMRVVVAPEHNVVVPVMGATTGSGLTETEAVAMPVQPELLVTL